MAVKILAADDSATMRKVLEMTFAGESVEIITVESGEAAVERAASEKPDLVIADASMAGVDGYELARRIKSSPATAQAAVVVLASQHNPFDGAKAKAAGVDDHILKPFDTQAMIDKAKDVLSRPRASVEGGAPSPVAAAPPSPPSPPALPTAPKPSPAVPRAATAPRSASPRSTVAFGAMQAPKPLELAEEPPKPARPAVPSPTATPSPAVASPARPTLKSKPGASPAASAAASATAPGGDLAARLGELGLDAGQLEGVLALSREVIERVVWEVVPDLAETIIRDEIRRLTAE